MTNAPESDSVPDDSPTPKEPPRPKRGAFPTPKTDVDKAKPYVPETGEVDDPTEAKPDSSKPDDEKGD